jgi:CheY-like chemotaxis protein
MVGENTEVDRSIIERLGDPLTHIIRNAVDHGIEKPEVRSAAGKPEEGTVRIAAEHRGGRIVIEVSDDGAGINPERVLKEARDRGLVSGMDKAALQPLDLIISDFNMPEMDGLALLRAVRGHPAARKVPFILLTGRGDRELVVQAAQAGANNYLIKPFTADILRQKIEQVMGRLS